MPNMWSRATRRLTILYSLLFIGFLVVFSSVLFIWVNSALGDGYVEQVSGQVGHVDQVDSVDMTAQNSQAARIAAGIAINHFRDILLTVDIIAIILVPFGAYLLTRRTLRPLIVSQEQQKQFIANASHELRTPLAVLSGELELALRKTQSAAHYKKAIASSKQEVDHMAHLTRELLLLAQLDEVTTKLSETTRIDVYDLMTDIQRQLTHKAKTRSIILSLECPKTITTTGSLTLLSTAVSNVVDNAIKYSRNHSNVDIRVTAVGQDHIRITVEDVGEGIPVTQQAHLFDRFYQARSSRSGEGFGLGLAITQKIITLHGGDIHFTSTKEGTIFYITL